MILEKYLNFLNTEDACGFAIDSFPNPAHNKPLIGRDENLEENIEEPSYDKNTKTIMIDLDGVLHKYSEGFKDGTLYDSAFEGAKESLKKLKDSGYKIIIFTSRLSSSSNGEDKIKIQKIRIMKWLKKNGIEVDGITSEKLPAEIYIDDRAIHFNGNWDDTMNEIKLRLGME